MKIPEPPKSSTNETVTLQIGDTVLIDDEYETEVVSILPNYIVGIRDASPENYLTYHLVRSERVKFVRRPEEDRDFSNYPEPYFGELLTPSEMSKRLGRNIDENLWNEHIKSGEVFALDIDGRVLIPVWQFDLQDPDMPLVQHLQVVIKDLRNAGVSDWQIANFMSSPWPELQDQIPSEMLIEATSEMINSASTALTGSELQDKTSRDALVEAFKKIDSVLHWADDIVWARSQ